NPARGLCRPSLARAFGLVKGHGGPSIPSRGYVLDTRATDDDADTTLVTSKARRMFPDPPSSSLVTARSETCCGAGQRPVRTRVRSEHMGFLDRFRRKDEPVAPVHRGGTATAPLVAST